MASRRKRLLEPDLPGGFDEDGARREASRLKVPALRAALAALDADASGLKAELVDRLVASQKAAAPPAVGDARAARSDRARAQPAALSH